MFVVEVFCVVLQFDQLFVFDCVYGGSIEVCFVDDVVVEYLYVVFIDGVES